jgi:hypothetical protein
VCEVEGVGRAVEVAAVRSSERERRGRTAVVVRGRWLRLEVALMGRGWARRSVRVMGWLDSLHLCACVPLLSVTLLLPSGSPFRRGGHRVPPLRHFRPFLSFFHLIWVSCSRLDSTLTPVHDYYVSAHLSASLPVSSLVYEPDLLTSRRVSGRPPTCERSATHPSPQFSDGTREELWTHDLCLDDLQSFYRPAQP